MYGSKRDAAKTREVPPPRPSSSILLLSPTNQVLLLHRVKSSSSFAAAHVFPGGNLDAFHDGDLPDPASPEAHCDSPAYRLGAIRECFEETGILLATSRDSASDTSLLSVDDAERANARKRIHSSEVRFGDWVDSLGGKPDVERLIPFTRWVTPVGPNRRFTTQMYLYMIPDAAASSQSSAAEAARQKEIIVPTPDGGVEHTAAQFDDAEVWLEAARSGEKILFPPQVFLLAMVARFCGDKPPATASEEAAREHHAAQRQRLVDFLQQVPTAERTEEHRNHRTSSIPWADKVMSPYTLFSRGSDGRIVLGLDKPGPELRGSQRGGDFDRVVLVRFTRDGPRRVEVAWRDEAFREEREHEAKEAQDEGPKL